MHLLPVAHTNLGAELEQAISLLASNAQVPFTGVILASVYYRRFAIAELLLGGDPQPYFLALGHSAWVTHCALERAQIGEAFTSACSGFLDAVASRNDDAARAILAAAPREPNLQREYEEEYLVMRTAMDAYDGASIAAHVDRLEELTQQQEDLRVPLLRAMVDHDERAWGAALLQWATALADEVEEKIVRDEIDPDVAVTEGRVSVDLLAWIELAERRGLASPDLVPLAPRAARMFHRAARPPRDGWRQHGGFLFS